ncbi:hypothetical protein GR254_24880, partial [Mycobacterium tuberculosis]|nr:hypothetical protein [Mycobacterium tuberculosis]
LHASGGSAHITAQVALAQGAEIHVMTRGAARAMVWFYFDGTDLTVYSMPQAAVPTSPPRSRWRKAPKYM